MILHTLDLRRYLVTLLIERGGSATVAELRLDLEADGFRVGGRASRTIPDAFRAEVRRGRVVRTGHGHDAIGDLPRTTRHRMIHRTAALRTLVRGVAR
ncbi:MAG: hypothetical protein AAGA90_04455 [Actinomycetota bacterium]